MKRPQILSDIDKYQLEVSDFTNQLDKFIFSAIYNLYQGGAESIHTIDIDMYLQSNSLAKDIMQKENGIGFLQDCEAYCEIENFNYYYSKLKKINLLRDLQKAGRDISEFYSENPLDANYNKINEKFEVMTTEDIINSLKGEIATFENKYVLNSVIEESNAYDGVKDLIEELKTIPEVGCPLQGDIFNTIIRGGRKGKMYLRSAGTSVGKAIPNSTVIPTPNGWRRVDEIKVGDYLFDRMGKPTMVLAVYPQIEKKETYKVYLKSGKIVECCEEHLWSYYKIPQGKKLYTSSLKEILQETNEKGFLNNHKYSYRIPVIKPVELEEKQYSIPPYIFGLILGDGSFRYSSNKSFMFASEDEYLPTIIAKEMKYQVKRHKTNKYCWFFEHLEPCEHQNVWVEDILKNYPCLWNKNSHNKFIPDEYLFGSIEQRLDLLRGLLDTDGGFTSSNGRVSYTTVSDSLRDNFISLVSSLGILTHLYVEEKKDGRKAYHIDLIVDNEKKPALFKLPRKRLAAEEYLKTHKGIQRGDRETDPIIKIEATGDYTDMTCFYVDNEEHLFAYDTTWCITHNTRSMVGDACNIAYPIRYEPKVGRWVATGHSEKILYVMTEQDPAEIQTMILAYLTGYNEEMFLYGTYTEEHMGRINKAIRIMETYKDNMLFARVPDPCASVIKNLFRKYSFQYGVENFFYDYIFSSPAMLNEYRDLKLPEHVCLRLFTTTLKNLAVELNAFILTSTQISGDDDENGGFRDYKRIRGSRSISDLVDCGCIMSRPSNEELKEIANFQKRYNFTPNCITDVFKNRRGRWNMVRIWSRKDLGTCRTYDLFITTADNKPIEDFQIVDFESIDTKKIRELEAIYNDGEIIAAPDFDESLTMVSEEPPESLLESVEKAFGDDEDNKKRLQDVEIGDLL
jgi:replicative DNA helicase